MSRKTWSSVLFTLLLAPYVMLDGRVVAQDFMELIEDGPRIGVSITEQGESVFTQFVWTNTAPTGEPYNMTDHCVAWISSDLALKTRQGLNALPAEIGPDSRSGAVNGTGPASSAARAPTPLTSTASRTASKRTPSDAATASRAATRAPARAPAPRP
jgi:hypothetical protein